MKPLVPSSRPALGVVYSLAAEHVDRINQLQEPSIVSLVSISEGLLRTAKSLFAPAIGKKHVLNEVLVTSENAPGVIDTDLAFCDTVTLGMVRSRSKVHYQLIAGDCLSSLRATLH